MKDLAQCTRLLERVVVKSLLVMMSIVVVLAALELAYILVLDIMEPPMLLLEIDQLLELFGLFMLVMIGLELLETIQIYHAERIIRVEVVVVVAIIAVCRKVIIMDYKELAHLTLLDVGAVILAMGLTYYVLRRTRDPHPPEKPVE